MIIIIMRKKKQIFIFDIEYKLCKQLFNLGISYNTNGIVKN